MGKDWLQKQIADTVARVDAGPEWMKPERFQSKPAPTGLVKSALPSFYGDRHADEIAEQAVAALSGHLAKAALFDEMVAALSECAEYLDPRADLNWEGDGPNTEMSLLTEVDAALAKAREIKGG